MVIRSLVRLFQIHIASARLVTSLAVLLKVRATPATAYSLMHRVIQSFIRKVPRPMT